MKYRTRRHRLETTSIALFGLLALCAVSCSAENTVSTPPVSSPSHTSADSSLDVLSSTKGLVDSEVPLAGAAEKTPVTTASSQEQAQAAEAARAYKQALSTLSNITSPPSPSDRSFGSYSTPSKSIISSFLPSPQGQGPVGSFIRILIKLHQQSWITRILSWLRFGRDGGGASKRKDEEMRGKAIKVVDLLQHSAELGHLDALYTLARISLFPPHIHFPSDPELAYKYFVEHVSHTGNATSQSVLAFFHATGYHRVVPVDQAKAQLYYTFAAHGGDKGAQMALGYRQWAGIGSLENCGKALEWYESAAEQAMAKFLSGPPGGRTLPQTATRLSDLVGGVYGPGASVASTGFNTPRFAIKAGLARAAGETWEDVVEYFLFNAERGETDFAYRLGKIYYQGSIYSSHGGIASGSEGVGAVPRDFALARKYFLRIARQVWPNDPPNPAQYVPSPPKDENAPIGRAAMSAGYLGRMALRGEGVKADPAVAKMWFERGAAYDDMECHNGLGIIWRDGLVQGRVDMKRAVEHFAAASGQELAEAIVNLGKYHYYRNEFKLAATYFESAIRHGSPFEAYYYMATLQSAQAREPSMPHSTANGLCAMAVTFFKLVAERGVWDEDLLHDAEMAWLSETDRGKELAILKWWIAAERGFEIAQNNLAHVLDQDKSILRLTRFSPFTPSNNTAKLALTQWTRSAAQTNVDALVKVGDYYYHGLGVSEEETTRMEKAARYYQSAADTQLSALAMWNLGWMHENGIGVPQDFHLAKRNYDLALETNTEAYLPVVLSLGKLYARSIWHTLRGGAGGLNLWYNDDDESILSQPRHSEGREIEGTTDESSDETVIAEDDPLVEEDDGPWYMGKAKEQFQKRRRGHGKARDEEDDPIQWARDRRNAEHERDSDFGPEDDFEGALRGHRGEEEMDEFAETVLLLSLCLLVSVLFYVRTRVVRAQQQRQQEQEQQGEQGEQGGDPPPPPPPPPPRDGDGGLFPLPGDPARDEWAVLR